MSTVTWNKTTVLASAAALVLVAAAGGYGVAQWRVHAVGGEGAAVSMAAAPASAPAAGERKVLYWYDPMKPDARFDKPGKSPFMDMELQPRYADEVTTGGVQVDSRLSQSLGLRLATVTREPLAAAVEAVGTLNFNDREVAIV